MFKEFKEFAMKGNVVDMAVGIIIGGAFGTIVKSLVDNVLMPPVGLLLGGGGFLRLLPSPEGRGEARPLQHTGRGSGCGRRLPQFRPLLECGHQLHHRGLRAVHAHQRDEPAEAGAGGAGGGAHHQGLSLLPYGYTHPCNAVPQLHVSTLNIHGP